MITTLRYFHPIFVCTCCCALAEGGEGALGGPGGGKATAAEMLARMSAGLRPVEAYAVRLLEEMHPVDVEAAAKKAIDELKVSSTDVKVSSTAKPWHCLEGTYIHIHGCRLAVW